MSLVFFTQEALRDISFIAIIELGLTLNAFGFEQVASGHLPLPTNHRKLGIPHLLLAPTSLPQGSVEFSFMWIHSSGSPHIFVFV
jgi:hypothetical protein